MSVWARAGLAVSLVALAMWAVPVALESYRAQEARTAAASHAAWGRLEDAERVLAEAAARHDRNADLFLALGAARERLARFRGSEAAARAALDAYARAAALDPLDAASHAAAAQIHVQLDALDEAAAAMAEALARDPRNAFYLATLGHVRELQGRNADAAALYRRSLAILQNDALEERLEALEGG